MTLDDELVERGRRVNDRLQSVADDLIGSGIPAGIVNQQKARALQTILAGKVADMNTEILKDQMFLDCCELAGIPPTRKQASKFRKGEGAAWAKFQEFIAYEAPKPEDNK